MGCVWGGVPGTEPMSQTNRPVLEGSAGNPGAIWGLGLGLGSGPSSFSVPSWSLEEEGPAEERSWPGQTLSSRFACPGQCWVGACSGASLRLAHSCLKSGAPSERTGGFRLRLRWGQVAAGNTHDLWGAETEPEGLGLTELGRLSVFR